ncbi:aspartate/glutamate racemase family protein [Brockia lithotrophica]|uniref:Aspartate racemase n=1 Tax=Brockia lithotrophica TaxID=933949 RepID=A0A660L1E0_9BACL|nr:aspartate/glutamate racemase family protein [Brockia lithotrophica]RKQ85438.1 aspartate racemase [Brockia lithotrophica]
MKRIGLIGGMSWESTLVYYREIQEGVRARLGGLHSADLVLHSLDFAPIASLQHAGDWETLGKILASSAEILERAGATAVLLCTNTMHKVAPAIEAVVRIPLLHIADATEEKIREAGLRTVGLLGTRFTMEDDFYRRRLEERFGLEVLVPEKPDRDEVHRVIYEELVVGKITPASKQTYLEIVDRLIGRGAEGIIFGCTEIGLLLSADDLPVPAFDTTRIHAQAAVDWILG